MKTISLIPKKKLKINPIKFQKPIYSQIKLGKSLIQDTDKDFFPDAVDCKPLDSSKGGLLGGLIRRRKARKDIELAIEHNMEPSEEMRQEYSGAQEEVSTATANAEMNMERGIASAQEHIKELPGQYRENIKAGFKGTEKNIGRFAKEYVKRSESSKGDPRMQKPEVTRGVHYLIPARIACRKMYHDANTGEPSSIPKYKRDKYVAFSPKTVGGGAFTPHFVSAPYLVKQKFKKYIEYLVSTGQYDKLHAIRQRLLERGEK